MDPIVAIRLDDPMHSSLNSAIRHVTRAALRPASYFRTLPRACALVAIAVAMACGAGSDAPASREHGGAVPSSSRARRSESQARASRTTDLDARVGFRSHSQEAQHFQKHGADFAGVTEAEYVRLAQALRDAPLGGEVEELRRPDGTISRYDRAHGSFVAFDADGTIRTFFKPNTGESYFRRQALHAH